MTNVDLESDLNHETIQACNRTLGEVQVAPLDEDRALLVQMAPRRRACFTLDLLSDLAQVQVACQAGRFGPFDTWILASTTPGVFNYGGDIELFADAIRNRDRRTLLGYGHLCINLVHQHRIGFGLPITTVALVQGDALGGGAEAALSAQIVVAERGAKIGFPEIMFNLFPGMGAFHILADRLGPTEAERMLLQGRIHNAEEFHELGLIDVLAEPGEGLTRTRRLLADNRATSNGRYGLATVRRDLSALDHRLLVHTVERWADRALDLREENLALIDHLVSRQHAKVETTVSD